MSIYEQMIQAQRIQNRHVKGPIMTIEGIDSVLLVESAQWSMFHAVRDHGGAAESVVRIDNLLDRRLSLMKYGPAYFQPVGQFI